ncbi:MAG: TRAP transporter substrate-binding protein DctP [Gammaproteobacteria bacterium]|nr:TRAP transporter substrate-binding protein DctP [Gammaproteobacteria bacterium]
MRTLFLPLIALALLAGCASPDEDGDTPTAQRFNVGGFMFSGSSDERHWQRFERNVREQAGDTLDPVMLVRGEAGPEETMLSELRRGRRIQVGGGSFQGLATIVPEIAVVSAPFLFDSIEEVDFVFDEYLFEPFSELFAAQGLVVLQYTDIGWVNLYAQKPILEPNDARGYPMRAASSLAALHFTESIGADSKSLPFTDIVPSLQTGLIRGGATSTTMYTYGGVMSEARHLSLSRHSYDKGFILANARWFASLDAHEQAVIRAAFGGHEVVREVTRRMVAETLESLPAQGIEVHAWSDEQRARWVEQAWPQHERLIRRVGGRAQEIYELILEGKQAFQDRQAANEAA